MVIDIANIFFYIIICIIIYSVIDFIILYNYSEIKKNIKTNIHVGPFIYGPYNRFLE